MNVISSTAELENIYGKPSDKSLNKVSTVITPLYLKWIQSARFVVVSTAGVDGCDASPRGDVDTLVKIPDTKTIWLPDWQGNNRLDSLKNIVNDGRMSLMFMISGCNEVVRINGTAVITTDAAQTSAFTRKDKSPKSVIVISIKEVYFQCSKALMRSDLWNSEHRPADIPTAGQFLHEQDNGFDYAAYDDGYMQYAKKKLW